MILQRITDPRLKNYEIMANLIEANLIEANLIGASEI
jgi:uncharacterized protein YjbI with pentapeptide repeats